MYERVYPSDNQSMNRGITLLLLTCSALSAAEHRTASLTISVNPAVVLSVEGTSSLGVKIRISSAVSAYLWIADACTATTSAPFVVAQSGEYHIPLSALHGSGSLACLSALLDGLTAEVQLPSKPIVPTIQSTSQAQTVSSI
jgi:hypothetical protein